MTKINLTQDEAEELRCGGAVEGIEHVEDLDYEDEGKYSYGGVIFKKDGKFYQLNISRTGSYYTDYYYDYVLDCVEVEKKTKTIEYWSAV